MARMGLGSVGRMLVGTATIVLLESLSALVSQTSVEAAVSTRIRHHLDTREVFVLPEDGELSYPGAEAILKRNGFRIRHCAPAPDSFHCFPWAAVARASVRTPFLVEVQWGFVAHPWALAGVRSVYFALFGVVFEIRSQPHWPIVAAHGA